MERKIKVAFIQGRPHGHPAHMEYAKSINADFYFVDHKIRYHDVLHAGSIRRYVSWIVSAFTFPLKKYDYIFTEEPYFMVGLMKWLGLLNQKQKLISLEDTHTLYFLKVNRYSASTKRANQLLIKAYDAFICVGDFQKRLLLDLADNSLSAPIYTIFNGVECERFEKLYKIVPDLMSNNIVFIGAVPNESRIWYKGLDLMLKAFERVKSHFPNLKFTVVGDYVPEQKDHLLKQYCPNHTDSVNFVGNVKNIDMYLEQAGLYFHISRGEAWGISINEAMAAGVIPIVSNCTGAMEVVEQVDEQLITTLDIDDIEKKLLWYFSLSLEEKMKMSQKGKDIIRDKYTEDKAVAYFRETFYKAIEKL